MGHRIRTAAQDESGFSLPEVLLGMILMLVVGFAALLAATTVERSTNLTAGRQSAAADARVALQRMTRDVREATAIVVTSPLLLDVTVPVRGSATATAHIRWDCASTPGSCARLRCTVALGSGCSPTGAAYTVAGLTNADVFTARNGQAALALPAGASATNLGATSVDFVEFHLRLRVDRKANGPQVTPSATHPNDFYDGADLAQYAN